MLNIFMGHYQSGKYILINPKKYRGEKHDIVWRSSWERKVFKFLDMNSNILWWNSEGIVIPYVSPIDKKPHRYFVDVIFKTISEKIYLIEIKPFKETQEPRAKNKARLLTETLTYIKNQTKWKAADEYCQKKGFEFKVWTEHDLKKLGIKL
jgi:hypothetical protein